MSFGQQMPQAPQQGFGGYPQQQYGAPQQQQQVAAPLATQSVDDFWAQAGSGGPGAPSFNFEQPMDFVDGTIVKQQVKQRTTTGMNPQPRFNRDNSPQMQLEITIQTELRGWAKVKNIPTAAPPAQGVQGPPLPPEADTGLRRIYVWYKLRDAVAAATGGKPTELGGRIRVQWTGQEPNPQGDKPIKTYTAWYKAPNPTEGFLQQPAAPAPQQQFAQQPQTYTGQAPQQAPGRAAAPSPQGFAGAPPAQGFQQPYQPPQGVPQGYAQNPAVQQAQVPGVQQPQGFAPYTDEPPF